VHRRDRQKRVNHRSDTADFDGLPLNPGCALVRVALEQRADTDHTISMAGMATNLAGFAAPLSALAANSEQMKLRAQS
jgi:hypothetical protein